MYHRSLRAFLPDKGQQRWASSALYFLWNLLLISARIAALALFASALPCLVPAHFLSLCLPLFLWAWLQRTRFMDSAAGEWFYRGTVAVIWYFSWFNVAEGQSRGRGVIYHALMVTDSGILLGAWWGLRGVELKQGVGVVISLLCAYLLGLLLKGLYYCCFHPKLHPQSVREEDVPDSHTPFRSCPPQPGSSSQLCNKRMACLASIFYTPVPVLPYGRLSNRTPNNGII
ncbi:hypothetical protein SKAU_G00330690 [Synaphobranchus kaupii]|uniref:XK-related protein n=1 Tax=Synaphobranchus kaupii TaxID=118154 RepID=A0A9Q1EL33_SYNKA|nr:hypothetical protein SKAU_G00330690 [Synaphobranchus kaupii]